MIYNNDNNVSAIIQSRRFYLFLPRGRRIRPGARDSYIEIIIDGVFFFFSCTFGGKELLEKGSTRNNNNIMAFIENSKTFDVVFVFILVGVL